MKLSEIRDLLDARVIVGEDKLDIEITTAFGADLMSDVLSFARSGCLLITGLSNPQAVRTAYALDIAAILVCRGKFLTDKFIETARELGIPILWTRFIIFESCGRLFQKGLTGCIRKTDGNEEKIIVR
ncbi:MAG: DRTGG domain-containing protein [Desulfomonilia bacterium]|nr:DRTGG domain-containing protein [Deltaproteobacteria bacterium]MDX9761731.1 DRTGG domain-containing protein [Desulfomonilia bacterium]HPW68453.1 DRTGG domain-containing protein [Deltaproteobacteria bacterium]